jgi:hypothetical protein
VDVNLEFFLKTFNFYDGSVGENCLIYVLDVRTFAAEKLPYDGTLVPKHVGVGT